MVKCVHESQWWTPHRFHWHCHDNESSYLESYLATDVWSPVPDAEENVAAMFSGVISSSSVCSVRG